MEIKLSSGEAHMCVLAFIRLPSAPQHYYRQESNHILPLITNEFPFVFPKAPLE